MREIKFRAWDKVSKKWLQAGQGLLGHIVAWETDERFALLGRGDFEIVQFTGLHDKNGKEIYEGDILTDRGDEGPLYIEYSNERGTFDLVDKFERFGPTRYAPFQISYEQFEVIGNIYENPELLEESTCKN